MNYELIYWDRNNPAIGRVDCVGTYLHCLAYYRAHHKPNNTLIISDASLDQAFNELESFVTIEPIEAKDEDVSTNIR